MAEKFDLNDIEEVDPNELGVALPVESALLPGNFATRLSDWTRSISPLNAALIAAFEALSGKDLVPKEEYLGALGFQNPMPTPGEVMERAGYLEDSPKLRSALGFGLGMATDLPTMFATGAGIANKRGMSKLAEALLKGEKATSPVMSYLAKPGLKWAGKGIWRRGFSDLDDAAARMGQNKKYLPSDVLMENQVSAWTPSGYSGEFKRTVDDLDEVAEAAAEAGQKIYQKTTGKPLLLDTDEILAPAKAYVDDLDTIADPDAKNLAKALRKDLKEREKLLRGTDHKRVKTVTQSKILNEQGQPIKKVKEEIVLGETARRSVPDAVKAKRFLTKKLSQSDWSEFKGTVPDKEYKQVLASGYRQGVETALNKAQPGLGDALADINQQLGTLLSVKSKVPAATIRMGNQLTPSPLAVGAGVGLNPAVGAALQAQKLAKYKPLQTKLGSGLYNLGKQSGKKGGTLNLETAASFKTQALNRALLSLFGEESNPPLMPLEEEFNIDDIEEVK